jgi:hypothetical protein
VDRHRQGESILAADVGSVIDSLEKARSADLVKVLELAAGERPQGDALYQSSVLKPPEKPVTRCVLCETRATRPHRKVNFVRRIGGIWYRHEEHAVCSLHSKECPKKLKAQPCHKMKDMKDVYLCINPNVMKYCIQLDSEIDQTYEEAAGDLRYNHRRA